MLSFICTVLPLTSVLLVNGYRKSMARGTFISMKRQKIKTLGSHSSFQTSAITAEEANTLDTAHY